MHTTERITKERKIALYTRRQSKSGIAAGDLVSVDRGSKTQEEGWGDLWLPEMNTTIGKQYYVTEVDPILGIQLSNKYRYPYFCLRVISKAAERAPKPTKGSIRFGGVSENIPGGTILGFEITYFKNNEGWHYQIGSGYYMVKSNSLKQAMNLCQKSVNRIMDGKITRFFEKCRKKVAAKKLEDLWNA